MLNKVRYAGKLVWFLAGTNGEKEGDARRPHTGHGGGNQAQTVL